MGSNYYHNNNNNHLLRQIGGIQDADDSVFSSSLSPITSPDDEDDHTVSHSSDSSIQRARLQPKFRLFHDLMLAIYRDDMDEMMRLINGQPTIPTVDPYEVLFQLHGDDILLNGDTVIHRAARMGRTKQVAHLLKIYLEANNNRIKSMTLATALCQLLNRRGETILHSAAAAGKSHVIEAILQTIYNHQPMLTPSEKRKFMMQRSSSVSAGGVDLDDFLNAKDDQLEKRTALHLIAAFDHDNDMTNYSMNGCYGGHSSSPGYLGPGVASSNNSGHAMAADLLIYHGVNVAELDTHGLTPFHLACINGHLDLVKLFYSVQPALVNEPTHDGWSRSPLHLAIQQAALVASDTATASASTSSATTTRGCRQQYPQAQNLLDRHLELIGWLLQSGADRNKKDAAGRLPQHVLLIRDQGREKKDLVKALSRLGLHQ